MEVLLSKFDELDDISREIQEIIDNEPKKQRNLDYLLSDYYHRLEDNDLSDIEILNIGKKIHEIRILRRSESMVSSLIDCYKKHKNKIQYSVKANREMFRQAIKLTAKNLQTEYKYRILNEEDLKELQVVRRKVKVVEEKGEKVCKKRRQRRKGLTKEQLEECLQNGMKNKDMAEKFEVFPTYISRMMKKYGLNKVVNKDETRISN